MRSYDPVRIKKWPVSFTILREHDPKYAIEDDEEVLEQEIMIQPEEEVIIDFEQMQIESS